MKRTSWKGKFFSFTWVLELVFCFAFEKMPYYSLPMLFVPSRKLSRETLRSSRSQMFFKIDVLKNFSIFARKHLCWSLFLTKLQTWDMYIVLLRNFIWRYNSLNVWVQNWRFCYFFYFCFVFLHNPSVWIGNTWLFRTCFGKFLVWVTFARITTSASVLFWLIW